MKKKLALFITTLVAALMFSTITAFAGTSFSTATTIHFNSTQYTSVSTGTAQYYTFEPTVNGVYKFYSTGSYDTICTLYNANQVEIKSNDDDGEGNNYLLSTQLTAGKKYYLSVAVYGGNSGSFYTYFNLDHETKDISGATVSLSNTKYTYNGSAKRPSVTVTYFGARLYQNEDYTVSYKNNKNVGKGTVTITGIGDYSGKITRKITISPKKIKSVIMRGVTYNGKKKFPAVKYKKKVVEYYDGEKYTYNTEATYKKGRDYTIKISGGHKQVGVYTATIKFKGNYRGTVKKKFTIHPRYVAKVNAAPYSKTQIKIKWNKQKNVSGYAIFRENANGKMKLYKKTTATSLIINRASKDDRYVYYKIRCYKTIGGKTYYNLSEHDYWGSCRVKPSAPKYKIEKYGFGEFTMEFNNYDSYEIQLSKYKDFKIHDRSCDVSTYKGYTSSLRWYSLNSGQKYYVRARVYYYDNKGRLKVGPWSKVRAVTPY